MNTSAHMIFGAAAFGRPGRPKVTLGALAGSFAPDLSLYLMVGVSLYALQISPRVVFDELYFSETWQRVFAVDNSFILWGALLAVAVWAGRTALVAFAGGGLLHLAFDFLLHHGDARRHFWPVSDWIFYSPFSYWDRRYYGDMIGLLELVASVLLAGVLLWRFRRWPMRVVVALLLGAEMMVSHAWRFIL